MVTGLKNLSYRTPVPPKTELRNPPCESANQITVALPLMLPYGTNSVRFERPPRPSRLSDELLRLSPMTNTWPGGTFTSRSA